MSREIKFRAWDKSMKKMIHPKLWDNSMPSNWEHWYELQQFTGLKDANDVEVFEGDILREVYKNNWEENNYSCFEVFFHDGDANSDYNIGFSMNRMHNHGSVCGGYVPSFKPKTLKRMCVIGNIYENPELLSERS